MSGSASHHYSDVKSLISWHKDLNCHRMLVAGNQVPSRQPKHWSAHHWVLWPASSRRHVTLGLWHPQHFHLGIVHVFFSILSYHFLASAPLGMNCSSRSQGISLPLPCPWHQPTQQPSDERETLQVSHLNFQTNWYGVDKLEFSQQMPIPLWPPWRTRVPRHLCPQYSEASYHSSTASPIFYSGPSTSIPETYHFFLRQVIAI